MDAGTRKDIAKDLSRLAANDDQLSTLKQLCGAGAFDRLIEYDDSVLPMIRDFSFDSHTKVSNTLTWQADNVVHSDTSSYNSARYIANNGFLRVGYDVAPDGTTRTTGLIAESRFSQSALDILKAVDAEAYNLKGTVPDAQAYDAALNAYKTALQNSLRGKVSEDDLKAADLNRTVQLAIDNKILTSFEARIFNLIMDEYRTGHEQFYEAKLLSPEPKKDMMRHLSSIENLYEKQKRKLEQQANP